MMKIIPEKGLQGKTFFAPLCLIVFMLIGVTGFSQEISVSGIVREKGVPMVAVSIVEKGTGNGTASDQEGRYAVKVSSPKAVLVFSFIGYKTKEVSVDNQT